MSLIYVSIAILLNQYFLINQSSLIHWVQIEIMQLTGYRTYSNIKLYGELKNRFDALFVQKKMWSLERNCLQKHDAR